MADPLQQVLKNRLRAFLDGPERRSRRYTEPIRRNTIEILRRATSRRWRTYIVGGAIRDLVLKPSGSWPRDVDVIVDGCSSDELDRVFGDLLVRHNSFGGLHLRKTVEIVRMGTTRYDLLFDLWRLEDTWAIKKDKLAPTISNFLKTPFLNIDSIAVVVTDPQGAAEIHENGFYQAVTTRTLEINNERNPFPAVCVVRSLILAAKLDFWIGPRLATFIQKLTRSVSISELLQAQVSHYGQMHFSEENINDWLTSLQSQTAGESKKVRLTNSASMQMQLWRDSPSDQARGPA